MNQPLPFNTTDEEFVALIDRWASLLEAGDYEGAFGLTDHMEEAGWDPEGIEEVIKAYGEGDPGQRVTLGNDGEGWQRKEVERHPTPNPHGFFGEIWYDLNINRRLSDLTATFALRQVEGGMVVCLDDIGVK